MLVNMSILVLLGWSGIDHSELGWAGPRPNIHCIAPAWPDA